MKGKSAKKKMNLNFGDNMTSQFCHFNLAGPHDYGKPQPDWADSHWANISVKEFKNKFIILNAIDGEIFIKLCKQIEYLDHLPMSSII